jgi:hypothetical protein
MGLNLGGIHVVKATVSGRLDIRGSLKQIENEYHLSLHTFIYDLMLFDVWNFHVEVSHVDPSSAAGM